MHIGEKAGRVLLNLADHEANSSIQTGFFINDTSLEWALDTALAHSLVSLSTDLLWVRECNAWWSGLAFRCFVDVSYRERMVSKRTMERDVDEDELTGSIGRRLVCSAEIVQCDVVADFVVLAVDAEVVVANAALRLSDDTIMFYKSISRCIPEDLRCRSSLRHP